MSSEQYEAVFDEMDTDNSGEVSFGEMKETMKRKGFTDGDMEKFFGAADVSGDGKVTKTEFMTAMGFASEEDIRGASWRRAFMLFDTDKSGSINKSELKKVMEEAGSHFSEDEINRMMEMMDSSGDDVISYDEFIDRFCKSS